MEERIIADLKSSYGLTCHQIAPVAGGWLNQKWKVHTDERDVLVKQFSNERFSRDQLRDIECALQRQMILKEMGIPCPHIRRCGDRAIRWLDDETAYMVMDFCPGKLESPHTITKAQMNSLGSACGRMHKAFSQLPSRSVKGFPLNSGHIMDALWTNYHARMQACPPDAPSEYREAVQALAPILNRLTHDFFDPLPKGIAHEDFSFDNILFGTECVSALLDFDRNQYSFIWHDVGRALLSFAWQDNRLDCEKISAFLKGYSQHLALTMPNIADALRLSWCIETPWWIQPQYFDETREKVVRFKDEMLWLTRRWFELDSILCSG